MAEVRPLVPALLVIGVFSRHAEALTWARQRLEAEWGPVGLVGPVFVFNQTDYYEPTMGARLLKQQLAFRDLIMPDRLPQIKRRTNELETDLAKSGTYAEPRPLNLDPGYLVLGKFILATTKDQGHRIYLSDGIFAEVTLQFRGRAFEPWPWTYADYKTEVVKTFLLSARDYYRSRLESTRA
jgi:hypothetical protein